MRAPLGISAVVVAALTTAAAANGMFIQQGPKLTGKGEVSTSVGGMFGSSVALSAGGNTALVGAPSDNAQRRIPFQGTGAAWVFVRSGSAWVHQGPKLIGTGEAGHADFGASVALSADGSTALIGGWFDHGGRGAAWVFVRSGSTWIQQGPKLTPRDEVGTGTFGDNVALSADGNTALISGSNDKNRGRISGAAWVFTRSDGVWTQHGPKLIGRGERGDGNFGSGVALSADGDTALIGGNLDQPRPTPTPVGSGVGAAWVFTRNGSAWTQQGSKLTARGERGPAAFGSSVALSGDGKTALIAGDLDRLAPPPFPGGPPAGAGAVWTFTRSGGRWAQNGAKLTDPANRKDAEFGYQVAISSDGSTALIIGSAPWIYTRAGTRWAKGPTKLTLAHGRSGFATGGTLSADGNIALIGDVDANGFKGAAWIFVRL